VYPSDEYLLMAEQALMLAKTETSDVRRRAIVDIAVAWSRLATEERSFRPAPAPANEYEHQPQHA
jgi:hypothetical protein